LALAVLFAELGSNVPVDDTCALPLVVAVELELAALAFT